MPRRIKAAAGVAAAGVAVGLLAIGWIKLHPAAEPVVNSKGGSVALNTADTPTPTPDPLALHVAEPNASSAQQGIAQQGSAAGDAGATNSNVSAARSNVPSPEDFGQYEQYKSATSALFGDIKVGGGEEVAAGKTATVAYRGYLTNGTLFDEGTTERPFSFTEGEHRVIAGWEEGLLGMKVGGQRRLIVPPAAGYGSEAKGPIPAGSVLVFDIELLGVK